MLKPNDFKTYEDWISYCNGLTLSDFKTYGEWCEYCNDLIIAEHDLSIDNENK